MAKYHRTTESIDAIAWATSNLSAIVAICPSAELRDIDEVSTLVVQTEDGSTRVLVGEYVAVDDEGNVYVYTAAQMAYFTSGASEALLEAAGTPVDGVKATLGNYGGSDANGEIGLTAVDYGAAATRSRSRSPTRSPPPRRRRSVSL